MIRSYWLERGHSVQVEAYKIRIGASPDGSSMGYSLQSPQRVAAQMTTSVEPLEVATADVIARYKRGNNMLVSCATALRRLRERVDAGEAGPEWDWPSY